MTPTVPVTELRETLLTELDQTLADAVRRASSRAEHIRLTRIQGLVHALYGASAETTEVHAV